MFWRKIWLCSLRHKRLLKLKFQINFFWRETVLEIWQFDLNNRELNPSYWILVFRCHLNTFKITLLIVTMTKPSEINFPLLFTVNIIKITFVRISCCGNIREIYEKESLQFPLKFSLNKCKQTKFFRA